MITSPAGTVEAFFAIPAIDNLNGDHRRCTMLFKFNLLFTKGILARAMIVATAILITMTPVSATEASGESDEQTATRRSSPNNPSKVLTGSAKTDDPNNQSQPAARFPADIRSVDGRSENGVELSPAPAGVPFIRLLRSDYADGIALPAGGNRPSARAVSNLCMGQSEPIPSAARFTDFLWQWGQFLDHDITLTPVADPLEPFDILVPNGDPYFDPNGTGDAVIPLDRSHFTVVNGVREQTNLITAVIDASNVYGSDAERAAALRSSDGSGRLRTSAGRLLPFNTAGLDNAPDNSAGYFLAGDFRANEQMGLTAVHTLFVREHNYWVANIRREDPSISGEQAYQYARAMVAAEIQAITYREFIPALLGPDALPDYAGHISSVNPAISNEFATAAYRLGHTMLSDTLQMLDGSGDQMAGSPLPLAQAFFRPSLIIDNGIEPVLRGLASHPCQEIDLKLVDGVRNFLFGAPGSGGFDLASLNIQRGRDHGLPSYNRARVGLGLDPVRRFADINRDPQIQNGLSEAYSTVDDIDLWVGGLAEPQQPGAVIGETFHRILVDQFQRLRDGDRFWYQSYLPPDMVRQVEQQTLSRIVRRNSAIGNELPGNVFRLPPPPPQ